MLEDSILAIVQKCKRHNIFDKIQEIIRKNDLFCFHHGGCYKMLQILQNLSSKKATQQVDIPVRIMKENIRFL